MLDDGIWLLNGSGWSLVKDSHLNLRGRNLDVDFLGLELWGHWRFGGELVLFFDMLSGCRVVRVQDSFSDH